MKKEDFLFYLKKALKGEMSSEKVKYYVSYYNSYIEEQVQSGRKMKDVMDELGDPFLIAKSIIESEKMNPANVYSDGSAGEESREQNRGQGERRVIRQIKLEMVIGIVVFVLFFMFLIAVIWGIFSLLVKIFFPVLLVLTIVGIVQVIRKS